LGIIVGYFSLIAEKLTCMTCHWPFLFCFLLSGATSFCQHNQHTSDSMSHGSMKNMSMPVSKTPANTPVLPDTTKPISNNKSPANRSVQMHHIADTTMPDMDMGEKMKGMNMESMSHAFSRNLLMNRNGSGTAWLPDVSPMYGWMIHRRHWMYMVHGNIFLRYNNQDFLRKGSRGDEKMDAPNWFMLMGQRLINEKGLFHFSTMFSLDAITVGASGYPLLFQSGEAYHGYPLVDRQHPHDLFSELAVSYAYAFSEKSDIFLYVGYPGEPALGPVAFMHRPSALYNPDAPLSHHWVDATHITFGVATLGLRCRNVKLEGSLFTGREPDEHRFGFDKPKFDSRSGRLSFNPGKHWALQVSHAFIKSPEELHPAENIYRTTASAIYSMQSKSGSMVDATIVYGLNKMKNKKGENAMLAEASCKKNKLAFYTKYEFVQKSSEELNLDPVLYGEHTLFPANSLTAGAGYDIWKSEKITMAAGGQFSIYPVTNRLQLLYGKTPMAFEIYLRLYPSPMKM
jgi:hypothetical protein